MIITDFTTTILKASEGFVITNSKDVDIKDRVFASEIALGKNDSQENWKEIPQAEADALKEAQVIALKEQQETE